MKLLILKCRLCSGYPKHIELESIKRYKIFCSDNETHEIVAIGHTEKEATENWNKINV